jgi:hypothetical protein
LAHDEGAAILAEPGIAMGTLPNGADIFPSRRSADALPRLSEMALKNGGKRHGIQAVGASEYGRVNAVDGHQCRAPGDVGGSQAHAPSSAVNILEARGMKNKFLTISAVVILAAQPILAGAATLLDAQPGADNAGKSLQLAPAGETSILLLAQQGQGQGQSLGQSQGQSQSQSNNGSQSNNTNQNTNQNENRNRNRNENHGNVGPAALAAITAKAVMKADHTCFYDSPSLEGPKFCVEPGSEATSSPAGWNDRISSIEIVGKAKVRVCTDVDFSGTCEVYRASVSALPKNLDNAISSWSVE